MPDRLAADGWIARENGDWAELKLDFLRYYGPVAIDATKKKLRRVYLDLFAGPGINIDQRGREFESGCLRVLQMRGEVHRELAFTDAFLVNLDSDDHAALRARVELLEASGRLVVPRDRVHLVPGDANAKLPSIISRIHLLDYLLVFADHENPSQWPWKSVQELRRHGHKSVDLYTLFPLEMGIRRLLDFRGEQRTRSPRILTDYFGCSDWEPIVDRRVTEAQSMQMAHELEALYLRRLREGWQFVDRAVAVRLRGEQGLYRMLFATNNEAGKKIAAWAKRRTEGRNQMLLGDGF